MSKASNSLPSAIPSAPTPEELERLRPLVRRLVWDPAEVDDILQEVWLAGMRGLGEVAQGARHSWLVTTARRISGHRRRRETERSDRETWARFGGKGADDEEFLSEAADQELERLDVMSRLLRGLQALPELERTAVSLRYLEGMPPRKIAPRIGQTPDQTRQILHRGLKRLRSSMDRDFNDQRRAWIAPMLGVGWPWPWRIGALWLAGGAVVAASALWLVPLLFPGEAADTEQVGALDRTRTSDLIESDSTGESLRLLAETASVDRQESAVEVMPTLSVVDGKTGAALAKVEVHWAWRASGDPWQMAERRGTGEPARWLRPEERDEAEEVQLLARAEGYRTRWWSLSGSLADQSWELPLFPLDQTIGGRVGNEREQALEGVVLRPCLVLEPLVPEDPQVTRIKQRESARLAEFDLDKEVGARTDEEGRWSLAVSERWQELEYRTEHPRYLSSRVIANHPREASTLAGGNHLLRLNSGRPVRGLVVDATGKGMRGVRIRTISRTGSRLLPPMTYGATDTKGWFEIGIPASFDGWLRAEDTRGRAAWMRYNAGLGNHRIELPDAADVELLLLDEQGDPLADWSLRWIDPGREAADCWAQTDAEGRALLTGLATGEAPLLAQSEGRRAMWPDLPQGRSKAWIWQLPGLEELDLSVQDSEGLPYAGELCLELVRRGPVGLQRRTLDVEELGPGERRVQFAADLLRDPHAWICASAEGHVRSYISLPQLSQSRSLQLEQLQNPGHLRTHAVRKDDLRVTFEVYTADQPIELAGEPPQAPAGLEDWTWCECAPPDLPRDMAVFAMGRTQRGSIEDLFFVGQLGAFAGEERPAARKFAAVRARVPRPEGANVRYAVSAVHAVRLAGVDLIQYVDHEHRPAVAGEVLRVNHLLPGRMRLSVERYVRVDPPELDPLTLAGLTEISAPWISPSGEALYLRRGLAGGLVAERLTGRLESDLVLREGRVTEFELPR